jgi:Holliday junction resolvasome RuvABC endonuclease subunit
MVGQKAPKVTNHSKRSQYLRVAGLDLSLRSTGLAILNLAGGGNLCNKWSGCALSNKLRGVERLQWIRDEIDIWLLSGLHNPDLVAIEGPSYGSTHRAMDIGELGGIVAVLLEDAHVPVIYVAPTQLKKFVAGNGAAKKETMLRSVGRKYGVKTTNDDIADAVGLAMCAYVYLTNDSTNRAELEVARSLREPHKKLRVKFDAPKTV